jgi:flagellar rod assembly protein/muramidase FlgJ
VDDMTREEFIKTILPAAMEGYKKYKILPSLTLAQAALESGWGRSHIQNNLFGIKATPSWKGKVAEVWTTEYINGKPQRVRALFRAYDSFAESVEDHSRLLGELPRYIKVREANNYREACHAVQAAGYATDPQYAAKLIDLIETNGFEKYDDEARKEHWAEGIWKKLNELGIPVYEKRYDDGATRGEVMALVLRAVKRILGE